MPTFTIITFGAAKIANDLICILHHEASKFRFAQYCYNALLLIITFYIVYSRRNTNCDAAWHLFFWFRSQVVWRDQKPRDWYNTKDRAGTQFRLALNRGTFEI